MYNEDGIIRQLDGTIVGLHPAASLLKLLRGFEIPIRRLYKLDKKIISKKEIKDFFRYKTLLSKTQYELIAKEVLGQEELGQFLARTQNNFLEKMQRVIEDEVVLAHVLEDQFLVREASVREKRLYSHFSEEPFEQVLENTRTREVFPLFIDDSGQQLYIYHRGEGIYSGAYNLDCYDYFAKMIIEREKKIKK